MNSPTGTEIHNGLIKNRKDGAVNGAAQALIESWSEVSASELLDSRLHDERCVMWILLFNERGDGWGNGHGDQAISEAQYTERFNCDTDICL